MSAKNKVRVMWGRVKNSNIKVTGIPERGEDGAEIVFEKIMAENQENYKTSSHTGSRRAKNLKQDKYKENCLQSNRESSKSRQRKKDATSNSNNSTDGQLFQER